VVVTVLSYAAANDFDREWLAMGPTAMLAPRTGMRLARFFVATPLRRHALE
jgi:hypothetical protein